MKLRLRDLKGKITPADVILLFLLLAISISGLIFIDNVMPQGTEVIIDVNGKQVYMLPLNTDKSVKVKGPLGDTLVEIRDGKVRITESPCPNKICIKQGWIKRGAIVCLPNRIVVRVNSTKDGNRKVDAITG
ncbi:MAG TPA: NusG domain II-containing protein [Nitrospirae bacterium]|nr:NusG domain II-containing protein [Nitrospirota bacterium]HDO23074.1 NusG domain II-containing protein [Nitrospirota bacterium]HDZ87757.1 NusG domain II-containing protein [Nitrospirota bacterium]